LRLNSESTSNYYNASAGGNGDQWTTTFALIGTCWEDSSLTSEATVTAGYSTANNVGQRNPGIYSRGGNQEWANTGQCLLDVDIAGVDTIRVWGGNGHAVTAKIAVYGVNYV